jgi:hypothetical protein
MDKHKAMSSKGGKNGKGAVKRRSAQHYAAMNKARWDKYRAQKGKQPQQEEKPTCSTCQRWTTTSVDRSMGHCGAYQIPASANDHCAQYLSNEIESHS